MYLKTKSHHDYMMYIVHFDHNIGKLDKYTQHIIFNMFETTQITSDTKFYNIKYNTVVTNIDFVSYFLKKEDKILQYLEFTGYSGPKILDQMIPILKFFRKSYIDINASFTKDDHHILNNLLYALQNLNIELTLVIDGKKYQNIQNIINNIKQNYDYNHMKSNIFISDLFHIILKYLIIKIEYYNITI